MAVSNLEEEIKKKEAVGSGAGAYLGGGEGDTGATTEKPTTSGSFTNISNYLDANQAGSGAMGAAIGSKVGEQGAEADTAVGNYQAAGAADVAGGTQSVDQGIMGDITKGTPIAQQNVTSAPQGAVYGGPLTVDATYKGKGGYSDIDGFSEAQGAVNKLGESVGQIQQGQIEPWLKDIYGGSNQYSQGENLLDTFVARAGAGGQAELNKVGQQWGGKKSAFEGINKTLQGNIDAGKATSKATEATYDTAIKGGQNAVAGVNAANDAAWQTYQEGQKPKPEAAAPAASTPSNPIDVSGMTDADWGGAGWGTGGTGTTSPYVTQQIDSWKNSLKPTPPAETETGGSQSISLPNILSAITQAGTGAVDYAEDQTKNWNNPKEWRI